MQSETRQSRIVQDRNYTGILTGSVWDILELSRKMKMAAIEGGWDSLSVLEEKRRVLFTDFFTKSISSENAVVMRELLSEIRKDNLEIIGMGELTLNELSAQLSAGKRSQLINNSYLDNMSGQAR
jgi:hypothetical protein